MFTITAPPFQLAPAPEQFQAAKPDPRSPLRQMIKNPLCNMLRRQALLNLPPEHFSGFFGGRTPTFQEKLLYVETCMQWADPTQVWENEVYQVEVFPSDQFIHLDIHRKDELPCDNWDDFQWIKDQLIGPDHEAVELYPAASRLVDTANQYHLWVLADATQRFAFGWAPVGPGRPPVRLDQISHALENAAAA